jgi:hypothetical protein
VNVIGIEYELQGGIFICMCYGAIRERAFLPVVVFVVAVRECDHLDALFPIQVYIGSEFCPFGNLWSSSSCSVLLLDALRLLVTFLEMLTYVFFMNVYTFFFLAA